MSNWKIKKQSNIETIAVKQDNPELWRKCELLEYEVFLDAGYIDPNPDKRLVDYDIYDDAEFVASFDGEHDKPYNERDVIGIMRNIYSPRDSKMKEGLFPTIDSAEKLGIYPEQYEKLMQMDPRTIVDTAAIAIRKDKRDSRASKSLISTTMFRTWQRPKARYAIGAFDTPFYDKMKERGLPWEDLSCSIMYWGSMSTAGLIDGNDILKGYQRIAIPYCKALGTVKRLLGRD